MRDLLHFRLLPSIARCSGAASRLPALTIVVLVVGWAAQAGAQASNIEYDPNIEVTPGSVAMDRVAVPDTTYEYESGLAESAELVSETIRRCLQIAGPFDVAVNQEFHDTSRELTDPETINFPAWEDALVSLQYVSPGLIRAHVERAEGGVRLDARLFDVVTGTEIAIGFDSLVVSETRVRHEAFRFVNLVIEYYTGAYGPFDGRIAAVLRESSGAKQVVTMNVDGSELEFFTNEDTIHILPELGADGRLYYSSYERGGPHLFADGEVFSARSGTNAAAAVRFDGEEIAAVLSVSDDFDVFVLDSHGEILRQCTDNDWEDLSPTWSPDGGMIAFVSDRSGGPQVFIMNADCSGQERVTFNGGYNTTPDWSPLGFEIAYSSLNVDGNHDIFAVDPGTHVVRPITQDQGSNEDPSWSPDGRYLVFASTREGHESRLYITTSDGNFQTPITPPDLEVMTPVWSP